MLGFRGLIGLISFSIKRVKPPSPLDTLIRKETQMLLPKPTIFQGTQYQKKVDLWKKNLERKQRLKANAKLKKESRVKQPQDSPKLVVHNPEQGITYPPPRHQYFFVVKIDNNQYKVTNDCRIILQHTKLDITPGQTHTFNDVLLIGSKDFTIIGRPSIKATVQCRVLEVSLTSKLIVFKKIRREQYKVNRGHRDRAIVFEIGEQLLSKAVRLQINQA